MKPRNMLTIAPYITFVGKNAMFNAFQSQPFNRHLTLQTVHKHLPLSAIYLHYNYKISKQCIRAIQTVPNDHHVSSENNSVE